MYYSNLTPWLDSYFVIASIAFVLAVGAIAGLLLDGRRVAPATAPTEFVRAA